MKSNLRHLFITAIALGSAIPAFAQHTINGRVVDEKGAPLTYANVVLLNSVDSTLLYFDVADKEGYYQIKNIKPSSYIIQFSFVTKKVIYEVITIPSDLGEELGDKIMVSAPVEEVVVTGDYVPIQFNQDTVSFNAKAFKTKTGAVVEDLLKKIPGIEVDQAGNIKALGEDVTKVLVDGKEFFGNDLQVATKNLPADAIDKVQVFDKKSEEAEFMGIDDGTRERTINLLLNEDNKRGYFGNVKGGGGSGSHYKADAKVYRFSSNFQSALLGMYNNVNEFNLTRHNMGGFGQQVTGLNTTAAGGMNLSYNADRLNRYFASYLASSTNSILKQATSTENFLPFGSYFQSEDLDEDERNTPHRANIGIRHNFGKKHRFILDGDIQFVSNSQVTDLLTETSLNNSLINNLDNTNNFKSSLSNGNFKIVDIVRLNEGKTQLKTSISAQFDYNSSDIDWNNTATKYNPESVTLEEQYQDINTNRVAFSVNPTLVQKLKKFWDISISFDVGSKTNTLDRAQGINKQDATLIDSLSADFSTSEIIVTPSLSLRRSTKKAQINFRLGRSWRQFDKVLDDGSIAQLDYVYLLPGISFNSNYRTGRHITLRYVSSVNMPSVTQLLPVINTVNKFSLYKGNIDLKPEYRHTASFMWSLFDSFSFTSLFMRVSGSYTKDKIGLSQVINEDFTRVSTPVNVDYDYMIFTNSYFSTPIRSLGLKVNATNRESWRKGISVINSEDNIQTIFTHTLDLSVENRRKGMLDIRVGGSISLTDSKYSITQDNTYFNTSYYTDITLTPNDHWTIETNGNVANYNAQSFDEAVSIPVINANISYHFLKGEKSSITLQAYDLLNKSVGFQRISDDNQLMQREWNTLGRYVMLTINLRLGI